MVMKLLVVLLFCGLVVANPIAITGSGSFEYSWPGYSNAIFYLVGDGVAIDMNWDRYDILFGLQTGYLSGGVYGNSGASSGYASINGIFSNFFGFNLGGDSGQLILFDSNNNTLASINLTGFVRVTSLTYVGSNPCTQDYYGTFSVTAPEPTTFWLIGLGFTAIAARRFRLSR